MSATAVAIPTTGWWRTADARAVAVLLVFCASAAGLKAIADDWLGYTDTLHFFLPYFGYLGDRLRHGDIPAWNPWYSGGAPMIGDPGSGWMYLPVMVAFTLFGTIAAMKVFILLLSVISGLALYAFTRTIGLSPVPALLTGGAFAICPLTNGATSDGLAVAMTLPLVAAGLLAAERAIWARRPPAFIAWSCLGGVVIVQNFASWPTQGLLFTGMYMVGWLAYRWLVSPIPEIGSRRTHLLKALAFGLIVIVVALTLGLSVILPVFSYANQSPIAGADYSNVEGATLGEPADLLYAISVFIGDFQPIGIWHSSGVVLVLALFAVAIGRNQYAVPFFAAAVVIFMDLGVHGSLLRPVFNYIPLFQRIHDHRPAAINTMVLPALMVLAGAGLQLFLEETRLRRALTAVAIASAAFTVAVLAAVQHDLLLGRWPIWTALATAIVLMVCALPLHRSERWQSIPVPQTVSIALIAIFLVFPFGFDVSGMIRGTEYTPSFSERNGPADHIHTLVERNLSTDDPASAAAFLQKQQALRQPFRYASYFGADAGLRGEFDHRLVASLSIGRSSALGLEQISGYNPIHLAWYAEYIDAMNGKVQDYHFTDLHWPALTDSQLMSMLNVRYVIVTREIAFTVPIAAYGKEVYRDTFVIVYENPYAFPRAWIVHDVQPAMDGQELELFKAKKVDGRKVAFVDGPLPVVGIPAGSGPGDEVVVKRSAPERLELSARSSTPGLLVVSQAYAEGWNAYIDGERVEVLRTNHALQGVPFPAGEHEVMMKYEPSALRIGLWGTGLASVAILGIWGWALVDWRRRTVRHAVVRTLIGVPPVSGIGGRPPLGTALRATRKKARTNASGDVHGGRQS